MKKISGVTRLNASQMVEDIIGCKWSLHILTSIRGGTHRPGALVRSEAGLTTKVLNERLRKMVRYRILEKEIFSEIPPRVEYHLTDIGKKLTDILDAVERLQQELDT